MRERQPQVLASAIAFSSEATATLLEAGLGLEIFLDMPGWYDEVVIENFLWKMRQSYGDFPLSFHASMAEGLDLSEPIGSPEQQKALAAFHRTIALAGRLGALHVVVHTHGHHRLIPDDVRPVLQQRIKGSLQLLGEWASQAKTKVVIENIGTEKTGTLLYREDEYLQLFADIPGIHSLVDIGHAFLNGWDTPALLQSLDARLAAVHIHDNHGRRDEHLPLGQGAIAWAAIADALVALPAPPVLVLEYEGGSDQEALAEILQGELLVRNWWKNATILQDLGLLLKRA